MAKKYELGFYLDPDPETIVANLGLLKEFGIKYFGTDGFMKWRDNAYTEAVADVIRREGMKLQSFHAPIGIVHPRPEDWGASLDDNRRVIDVAASWGARNIVWHHRWPRSYEGDTHFADLAVIVGLGGKAIDRLVDKILPETCSYAAERGININLENLPLFTWGYDCHELLELVRAEAIPNFGFIYDIGHAWCSGLDPAAAILDAGPLLNDTHFHDNLGLEGWDWSRPADWPDVKQADLHLAVGLGTINWVEVIRALNTINYSNPVIFELGGRQAVETTINNWRQLEALTERVDKLDRETPPARKG